MDILFATITALLAIGIYVQDRHNQSHLSATDHAEAQSYLQQENPV